MFLVALLLVLTGTVSAEVYLHPNESAVAICNGTTLTCVTTDTGRLRWSTPAYSSTFLSSDDLNVEINLGDIDITVQLTSKIGLILTSVATITGSNSTLNGTTISCEDLSGIVRSKILLIPVLSELGFKALNFTSATIYWATWPSVKSKCVHNYSILVQNVHTQSISDNTTTAATSLNVTGLTRGEEYIVTVSTRQRKKTVMMILEVADSVTDLVVMITILNSREFFLKVSWKQPFSSHPPVLHYVVTHNVTDTGSSFPQEITYDTNITFYGVNLSNLYFIQVTPFSSLGRGHSAMRVVVTIAEDPTQGMHVCSCAVQLGVSLPISALLMVAGCFITAFVTIKRNRIAFWAKALITPKPSLQAHHKNTEVQVDPQAMSQNLAYEEQEPGYATKFHPYNNANTALVKVACHVYEQPPQVNSKHN